jgi:cytoskeletal protein CcmA (bactofilin family)
MLFKKNKKFHIDTLIDKGMVIRGNTVVTGGVRLDGKIYGNLTIKGIDGSLIMGQGSLVDGNITVASAIIGGQVNGDIKSSDYLEFHDGAKIKGNIEYKIIEVQQGSILDGRLKQLTKTESKKIEKSIINTNLKKQIGRKNGK